MTFDERLREIRIEHHELDLEGNRVQVRQIPLTSTAITAIKQAMRETGPERLSKADVANFNTPEGYPEFSEEDWANGYNTAIDDVEKGFGL